MHIWKTIKIFVSSTFKDLELERDQLAKVFQNLQEYIYERRLHLIPQDLRWREQHADMNIVKWCLEVVENSQYFVGILGYRYGWRPPENQSGRENTKQLSITEMEIDHALLHIPKEKRFFCFGDLNQYSEQQLSSESDEDKFSMKKLKERLKNLGETIFEYTSTQEVIDIIDTTLREKFDSLYPKGEKVELESYSYKDALDEIIEEKRKGFIGRRTYLEYMEQFCHKHDDNNTLIIHSVAGSGKSALLANFIHTWRNKEDIPIVSHYMSSGGDSRTVLGLLTSIGSQLQAVGCIKKELETLPEQLSIQIGRALQSYDKKLIITIDGMDETTETGKKLQWYPRILPKSIRMILTTRPVAPFEQLKKIKNRELCELSPLTNQEISEIILHYCKQHTLHISENDKEVLIERACGNPLFLKVALDEMVAGGVGVAQLAESIDALFRQIFHRLKKRYGEDIVCSYLGFIAASRNGLAHSELRNIMKSQYDKLYDDTLLKLAKGLANFVIQREKLLNFFHPEFERSIKMLLGKSGMRIYHQKLAEYFYDSRYIYERAVSELPYQLQWGEKYEELLQLLTDIAFLEHKASIGMLVELRYDIDLALNSNIVGIPDTLHIEITPNIIVSKETIELMWRALEMDIQFLGQNPQHIFQVLWNRCYWYDAPQAQSHYQESELSFEESSKRIYKLAEYWREIKEREEGFIWIKSLRPLPDRIDSPLIKTFRGHGGAVRGITISSDGRKVVSSSYDGTVKIWNAGIGQAMKTFHLGGGEVRAVCLSIDENKIIAGSDDGVIRIYDIDSSQLLTSIEAHKGNIFAVCVSRDGQFFASGGEDNCVKVWDMKTFTCLSIIERHTSAVLSVCFTHDSKNIISGSEDNSILLCDRDTTEIVKTFQGHKNKVYQALISSDGSKVLSCSRDKTLKIWDYESTSCLKTITEETIIYDMDISRDGKTLVSASWDKRIRIWDVETGECLGIMRGHEDSVFDICFTKDEKKILSGSNDGTIRLWDLTSKQVYVKLKDHDYKVQGICFHQQYLISYGNDCAIRIWDYMGNCLRVLEGHEWRITTLCLSHDKKKIISGSTDTTVRIWDIETGACLHVLHEHEFEIWCLSVSANGQYIASGAMDDKVIIWDVQSAQSYLVLKSHASPVSDVVLSDDGRYVLSGSFDKTVHLWDLKMQAMKEFEGHTGAITKVYLSKDYSFVVSASKDKTIRIWDTETGECLLLLEHPDVVSNLVVSENETIIIASTQSLKSFSSYYSLEEDISYREGAVFAWDIYTGECLFQMDGSTDIKRLLASLEANQYYAVVQKNELSIMDSQDNHVVGSFPAILSQANISLENTITGTLYSHTAFLKLSGKSLEAKG